MTKLKNGCRSRWFAGVFVYNNLVWLENGGCNGDTWNFQCSNGGKINGRPDRQDHDKRNGTYEPAGDAASDDVEIQRVRRGSNG